MACAACSATVQAGHRFCPQCGAPAQPGLTPQTGRILEEFQTRLTHSPHQMPTRSGYRVGPSPLRWSRILELHLHRHPMRPEKGQEGVCEDQDAHHLQDLLER